eukprot:COSAG02_NODE_712_length_18122_cov_6.792321_1_plen_308_part_00
MAKPRETQTFSSNLGNDTANCLNYILESRKQQYLIASPAPLRLAVPGALEKHEVDQENSSEQRRLIRRRCSFRERTTKIVCVRHSLLKPATQRRRLELPNFGFAVGGLRGRERCACRVTDVEHSIAQRVVHDQTRPLDGVARLRDVRSNVNGKGGGQGTGAALSDRADQQSAVLSPGASVDVHLLQTAAAARSSTTERAFESKSRGVWAPARVDAHLERSPRPTDIAIDTTARLVGKEALALREWTLARTEHGVLVLGLETRQRLHHLHVLLDKDVTTLSQDGLPATIATGSARIGMSVSYPMLCWH